MDWGMQNRLNQLFPDGKCFFMPIDHGYFQGPTRCLEKPGETSSLLPYCDALFVTREHARPSMKLGKPIILRVSAPAWGVWPTSDHDFKGSHPAKCGGGRASVFIGSIMKRLCNLAAMMPENYGSR